MQLELTDKERLILSNRYEILAFLKRDCSYILLAAQLRAGHKWRYQKSLGALSENLPDEDTELVLDILEVHKALKISYDALTDKSGISIQDVSFAGFDGDNESELMDFVDTLKKSNHFVNIINAGERNSHTPKVHTYQNMIQKWHELDRSFTLTKDQILYILG